MRSIWINARSIGLLFTRKRIKDGKKSFFLLMEWVRALLLLLVQNGRVDTHTNVKKGILTRSFLSFLIGLRESCFGESRSGIWSGGCDIVWRLFSSSSFFFNANTVGKMFRLTKLILEKKTRGTHHPYFDWKVVCLLDFVRIWALDDQRVSSLSHRTCVQSNDTSIRSVARDQLCLLVPVPSIWRMCDVQRMTSITSSQHDDYPIWNQSSIHTAQIHLVLS